MKAAKNKSYASKKASAMSRSYSVGFGSTIKTPKFKAKTFAKENPNHNKTTVLNSKRSNVRQVEFERPVRPEIQLPLRDVSNSPTKGLLSSDYSRRSYSVANHNSNCIDIAKDLLLSSVAGGNQTAFIDEQNTIKNELVSILSDLKFSKDNHQTQEPAILKTSTLNKQKKTRNTLHQTRLSMPTAQTTKMINSSNSMQLLDKFGSQRQSVTSGTLNKSMSHVFTRKRPSRESSLILSKSSRSNSNSRSRQRTQTKSSIKTSSGPIKKLNQDKKIEVPRVKKLKKSYQTEQLQQQAEATVLYEQGLQHKVFCLLKRFLMLNREAQQLKVRLSVATRHRNLKLMFKCFNIFKRKGRSISNSRIYSSFDNRQSSKLTNSFDNRKSKMTSSLDNRSRSSDLKKSFKSLTQSSKRVTIARNNSVGQIPSSKGSNLKKNSSIRTQSSGKRKLSRKSQSSGKKNFSDQKSYSKRSRHSNDFFVGEHILSNSTRKGVLDNKQMKMPPVDFTQSAVHPGSTVSANNNPDLSFCINETPQRRIVDGMTIPPSSLKDFRQNPHNMETLKSSLGGKKNSQESLDRLTQILTDKKRQDKSYERIINASLKKKKVKQAFEERNWSSQNDRTISYANIISQKILTRSRCIKVFKSLRLAIQKREAREELFVYQRKRAFFTAFIRGLQKRRNLRFNAQQYNLFKILRMKQQTFKLWLHGAISNQKIFNFRKKVLTQKSLIALNCYSQTKCKERQIKNFCRQHHQIKLLRNIIRDWRQWQEVQVQKGKIQQKYTNLVNKKKKLRLLKFWFNRVDMVHEKQLSKQHAQKSELNQHKKRVFEAWQKKMLIRKTFKENILRLKVNNFKNFLGRFFKPWHGIAEQRQTTKFKLIRGRARRLLTKAFDSLRFYSKASANLNQKIQAIVKLRAKNLLKLAFEEGLVEYTNESRIKFKKTQVACVLFTANYLAKGFQGLVKHRNLMKVAKEVKARKNYVTANWCVNNWHKVCRLRQKFKKYMTKKRIETNFKVFRALFENKQKTIRRRAQVAISLQAYGKRLYESAIASWKHYTGLRNARKEVYQRTMEFYSQRRMVQCLHFFKTFVAIKKEDKIREQVAIDQITFTRMGQALFAWRKHIEENRYKKKYIPLLYKLNLRTKFEVFKTLQQHQALKIKNNLLIEHMTIIRNTHTKESVFDDFVRFMRIQQIKKEQSQRMTNFLDYNLKKKTLQALFVNKIQSLIDKKATKEIHVNRRKTVFVKWFNYVHEFIELERQADQQFKIKRFQVFCNVLKSMKGLKRRRAELRQLSHEYQIYSRKKRGLRMLFVNMSQKICDRTKEALSENIAKSRVFQAWASAVPMLKHSNQLNEAQAIFWDRMVKRRTLKALFLYKERRIIDKETVRQYREQKNFEIMANCFQEIVYDNYDQKVKMTNMLKILQPGVLLNLKEAFENWREAMQMINKNNIARKFYNSRSGRYVKARVLDGWLLHTAQESAKTRKIKLVRKIREHSMQRVFLYKLYKYTKHKMYLKNSGESIAQKLRFKLMQKCFTGLHFKSSHAKWKQQITQNVVSNHMVSLKRKAFIALQKTFLIAQKQKALEEKVGSRMRADFFLTWTQKYVASAKIQRMFNVWQDQQEKRLIRKFLPNLLQSGHHMVLYKQVKKGCDKQLMTKALGALKKNRLNKLIISQFALRRKLSIQLSAFMSLKENWYEKLDLRENVLQQASIISFEENFSIKEQCFSELKDHMIRSKMRKLSRRKYAIQLMSEAMNALRENTRKRAIERACFLQVQKMRQQKFFWYWSKAYQKCGKEKAAKNVLNFQWKHQIWQEWKEFVDRSKTEKDFRRNQTNFQLKRQVFANWGQFKIMNQYWTEVTAKMGAKRQQKLVKSCFQGFKDHLKFKKIKQTIDMLYLYNIRRKVVQGWKQQKDEMNHYRLHLIKQRAVFKARPELRRPLLAMKNIELFRAWQLFVDNCQSKIRVKSNYHISTQATYLRLMRKSFYALRLNSAQNFQSRKSRQIKKLILKRRWFFNLRTAAQKSKQQRQKVNQAAIFRFLSLQKQALHGWASCVFKKKESKIKAHFALKIYFKRLQDKGFTILKMYRQKRMKLRLAQKLKKMQALKKSNKINQKLLGFDQTLDFNENQAEFELENREDGSLRVGDALKPEFNTNPTTFSIYQSGSIQMMQGEPPTNESEIQIIEDQPVQHQDNDYTSEMNIIRQMSNNQLLVESGMLEQGFDNKFYAHESFNVQQPRMLMPGQSNELPYQESVLNENGQTSSFDTGNLKNLALPHQIYNGSATSSPNYINFKNSNGLSPVSDDPNKLTLGQYTNVINQYQNEFQNAQFENRQLSPSPISEGNSTDSSGLKAARMPQEMIPISQKPYRPVTTSSRNVQRSQVKTSQTNSSQDYMRKQSRRSSSRGNGSASSIGPPVFQQPVASGLMSNSQSETQIAQKQVQAFMNEDLIRVETSDQKMTAPRIHKQTRNAPMQASGQGSSVTQKKRWAV